jgi:hypothetical protein
MQANFRGRVVFCGGFTNENTAAKESEGVFHAPQNLEKGGHGISPCTMHHLKMLFCPVCEALCFAHSLVVVESRINFRE